MRFNYDCVINARQRQICMLTANGVQWTIGSRGRILRTNGASYKGFFFWRACNLRSEHASLALHNQIDVPVVYRQIKWRFRLHEYFTRLAL